MPKFSIEAFKQLIKLVQQGLGQKIDSSDEIGESNVLDMCKNAGVLNGVTITDNVYNDQEVCIGSWFGKPLYRRVIPGTIDRMGTWANWSEDVIDAVDTICNFHGYTDLHDTQITSGFTSLPNNLCSIGYDQTTHKIVYYNSSTKSYNNVNGVICIEYTKTTDADDEMHFVFPGKASDEPQMDESEFTTLYPNPEMTSIGSVGSWASGVRSWASSAMSWASGVRSSASWAPASGFTSLRAKLSEIQGG